VASLHEAILKSLRKPVRSASGVVVVALMSSPAKCPHGKCIYCPRGENAAQSYTGNEPSSMRAIQNVYDPALQVRERLKQLRDGGHSTDKVEVIIQGGTFPARPYEYQEWFVKRILDEMNGRIAPNLESAKSLSSTAKHRCVALTVETRPDYCREREVDLMLKLGVTRVEIGVQTLSDEVYLKVKRGHTVEDVEKAFQIARDSGLKIVAHMMPGLPGVSREEDLSSFRALYTDDGFKPDMLKIYPTLVLAGTELYDLWLRGEYRPLNDMEAAELVAEVKAMTPPWIRIMRVQRDVPSNLIVAGVKKSNLRQIAQEILRRRNLRCNCIRCREIGLKILKGELKEPPDLSLTRINYSASGGMEIFLSFEDPKRVVLAAYLRLRVPSEKAHRREINETRSCIVRELKSLGRALPIGLKADKFSWQHRGLGRKLLMEAERIAVEEYDVRKMVIISAVGTRGYYAKFGYKLEGPYMVKELIA